MARNSKMCQFNPDYLKYLQQDVELGGFILQQNVSGNTQAVFRFPARVNFAPNSAITVWSGSNDPMMHQPPTDFRFSEHQKWESGAGCTTILCKPNGQVRTKFKKKS